MASSEPVVIVNTIVTALEAGIMLLAGFNITSWGNEEIALLMAFIVAVSNVVKTLLSRSKVTPVSDPRNGLANC